MHATQERFHLIELDTCRSKDLWATGEVIHYGYR